MSENVKHYLINSTTTQKTPDGYWRWTNPVNYSSSIQYKKVSVTQVGLTMSYYNFKNDTFIWIEDDGATNLTTLTVNIRNGNYSQNQMASHLKTLMDAESIANGNSYTYTITYDSISDEFTMTSSANTFAISDGTLNDPIGYEPTDQAISHVSVKYTNMNRYTNFYLKSDIGSQDAYSTMSGRPSSTLAVVPLKGNSGDTVFTDYPNPMKVRTTSNFDQINFRLETLNNQQVDLRGGHWTAVLTVQY